MVVVVFWREPLITLLLLMSLGLVLNAVTGWRLIKVYLITALLGCAAEVICIQAGAWQYGSPQFLGIPIWLPFVWGNASVLFFELAGQFGHTHVSTPKKHSRPKRAFR
ncbi:MAG TPA: hypothetical protein VK674_06395 [Candidatus Limnocylindria bacterium]|nr:hypothetical protein [Candidatus Limnocylindria bacterium]